MTLAHDSSKRVKKARPLVVGERCYVQITNGLMLSLQVPRTVAEAMIHR